MKGSPLELVKKMNETNSQESSTNEQDVLNDIKTDILKEVSDLSMTSDFLWLHNTFKEYLLEQDIELENDYFYKIIEERITKVFNKYK